MAKDAIVTAAHLAAIPAMLDRGMSPEEIAAELGCTVGTLRVRCCRAKVSLRRNGDQPRRPRQPARKQVAIDMKACTFEELRVRADSRGISASCLVGRLLETIVADDLFTAVLDD
jgi:hypothetical protein